MTLTFIIICVLIFYVLIKLLTQSFADFLDKGAKTTLWIWLPFKALQHLLKEFREKKLR
jgi:hypothetical protein